VGKDINAPKVDYLAAKVKTGSIAFLKEEYKYLAIFVLILAIALGLLYGFNPVTKGKLNMQGHLASLQWIDSCGHELGTRPYGLTGPYWDFQKWMTKKFQH